MNTLMEAIDKYVLVSNQIAVKKSQGHYVLDLELQMAVVRTMIAEKVKNI